MVQEIIRALMNGETIETIDGCYEVYARPVEGDWEGYKFAIFYTHQWTGEEDYIYFRDLDEVEEIINRLREVL